MIRKIGGNINFEDFRISNENVKSFEYHLIKIIIILIFHNIYTV